MSSQDAIAEQASLRTAAFEQQHEDRSHALELHSDQIVEYIAWYETLKLHVPHPVVSPLERKRPQKVLSRDEGVRK